MSLYAVQNEASRFKILLSDLPPGDLTKAVQASTGALVTIRHKDDLIDHLKPYIDQELAGFKNEAFGNWLDCTLQDIQLAIESAQDYYIQEINVKGFKQSQYAVPHLRLSKSEINILMSQTLNELLEEAGGVADLAIALELPYQTVKSWRHRGRISKDGARKVAKHPVLQEKFNILDLRPDIYKQSSNDKEQLDD